MPGQDNLITGIERKSTIQRKDVKVAYVTVKSQITLIRRVAFGEIFFGIVILLSQTVAIASSHQFATRSLTGVWTSWFFLMSAGFSLFWSSRCTFNGLLAVLVLQIISATMGIPLFTATCLLFGVYPFKWSLASNGEDIALIGSSISILVTNLVMMLCSIAQSALNIYNAYNCYFLAYGEAKENQYDYDGNGRGNGCAAVGVTGNGNKGNQAPHGTRDTGTGKNQTNSSRANSGNGNLRISSSSESRNTSGKNLNQSSSSSSNVNKSSSNFNQYKQNSSGGNHNYNSAVQNQANSVEEDWNNCATGNSNSNNGNFNSQSQNDNSNSGNQNNGDEDQWDGPGNQTHGNYGNQNEVHSCYNNEIVQYDDAAMPKLPPDHTLAVLDIIIIKYCGVTGVFLAFLIFCCQVYASM